MDWNSLTLRPAKPLPLGAHLTEKGIRFSIVSRHATHVWLALFEDNAEQAAREYSLESDAHKHGDVWCVEVVGIGDGTRYAYRMDGPAGLGHDYDSARYLLDPYARSIAGDIGAGTARCVVTVSEPASNVAAYPRAALGDSVIYETHVRGFTRHESSGAAEPGTYRGLIEKIPYLQSLGVTAVELLPVQECGEVTLGRCNIESRQELVNYWGYQTIGFFAPTARYATGDPTAEFKTLSAALHAVGMELYLDVVYNHTPEHLNHTRSRSFRGIDQRLYYMQDEQGEIRDLTGCANTLSCNEPVVADLIVDSLRYWVLEMGVDGFRFDLASVLHRGPDGILLDSSPLIERISADPILRDTKLIAEPWDLGGAYQVGTFGTPRWSDWNGKYRDDVRRYWCGHGHAKGDFARRITGSPDVYQNHGRRPHNSINFIAAHDGFTLRDLVSYNRKHNSANGEANRDGNNHNNSWNCGVEGETDNREINALRLRMQKNLLATLFLSLGCPMLLGGDERGRTQRGNNNAWCQDNALSWIDWTDSALQRELQRFCTSIIQFRKTNSVFHRNTFFTGAPIQEDAEPDLLWFDSEGNPQDWGQGEEALACRIDATVNEGTTLYILFNPEILAVQFRVPRGSWRVRVDTAMPAPHDVILDGERRIIQGNRPVVLGRKSLMVLAEC